MLTKELEVIKENTQNSKSLSAYQDAYSSTPKPSKSEEPNCSDDLQLPLSVKDRESSLNETALLITDSDFVLNQDYSTECTPVLITPQSDIKFNQEDSVSGVQIGAPPLPGDPVYNRSSISVQKRDSTIAVDVECVPTMTECTSTRSDKVKDPRIWALTLSQIAEAKPCTRHSLEQICESPDGNLSLVTVDESGDLPPTLLSWSREKAHAYLTKHKINVTMDVLAQESCKQMLWRLFLLRDAYNHNINGTVTKQCLDTNRVKAIFRAYKSLVSSLEITTSAPTLEALTTYINNRLRKQIHKGILPHIDITSLT